MLSLPLLLATTAQSDPLARAPGPTSIFVANPAGTRFSQPITNVLAFQVDRFANQIGTWAATVPADSGLDDSGSIMSAAIRTGWKVSILQEHNTPFGAGSTYLLTDGVVERREFIPAEGGVVLALSGSFREVFLTREQIHNTLSYDTSVHAIAESLATENVITPAINHSTLKVDFNGGTRYAALLTLGEAARLTLRENWDGDALEFTAIDGAPDSGITLINVEQAQPNMGF
jgi:hypothetical protein